MDEKFYTCAECGKKFYNTYIEQYIYKKYDRTSGNTIYFCGWNCLRKYEKKREEEKKARRLRK